MIRLSRLADYGVVLMTQLARHPESTRTAPEMAAQTGLPAPTVSKLLKRLAQAGLLVSHRGTKGGYALARQPEEISVAAVIGALDGPVMLTECMGHVGGTCEIEAMCPTRTNWRRINDAVHGALAQVSLAEMAVPFPTAPARPMAAASQVAAE